MRTSREGNPVHDDFRHSRAAFFIRVGTGIWLIALTAILFHRRRDRWVSVLLVPSAALHFYLAYRLRSSRRA